MIQRKSINNNPRSDKQNKYIRLYPHPSYGIHCGSQELHIIMLDATILSTYLVLPILCRKRKTNEFQHFNQQRLVTD